MLKTIIFSCHCFINATVDLPIMYCGVTVKNPNVSMYRLNPTGNRNIRINELRLTNKYTPYIMLQMMLKF